MSISKKLQKTIYQLFKQIVKLGKTITKSLMNWLLRSLMVIGRNRRLQRAGFVLPTVVMVTLVVILLTTAIMLRSFDRSKNAGNVRINERVMAATSPAIERAQAKIRALLGDPTLPRGTPTDEALKTSITGNLTAYTLGDETPLQLSDGTTTIETAWRFPIDTDNNGLYDSYGLYGIYFANPGVNDARSTLQARSQPMDEAEGSEACGIGTAASLVGSSGWYKTSDGNLRRAFFVFAATVPITQPDAANNEEAFQGSNGFAALEYQQDQARIPLTNNAVVYQDDLFIDPGAGIKLNGRIMTGGNLIIGQGNNEVRLLQVSGTGSCFYTEDNGDITVGGNVMIALRDDGSKKNAINIDLFQEGAVPTINAEFADANASITNDAREGTYNDLAYAERIGLLVAASVANPPPEVTTVVNDPNTDITLEEALEDYFIQRTRRVPFIEAVDVAVATEDDGTDNMRPKPDWIYPADPATGAALNGLTLRQQQPPATNPADLEGDELELGDRMTVGNGLPAEWWEPDLARFVNFYDQQPQFVGGSNTPNAVTWNGSAEPRTRMTQVIPLDDIGDTSRGGFWEQQAAQAPNQPLDGTGGLRVITGAGIYDPSITDIVGDPLNNTSFLSDPNTGARQVTEQTPDAPPFTLGLGKPIFDVRDDLSTFEDESLQDDPRTAAVEGFTVVFPDSMAMWEDYDASGNPDRIPTPVTDRRGDLMMRATAVYHYRSGSTDPIACVSSYYNPSNSQTAENLATLPDGTTPSPWQPPGVAATPIGNGLSNNGISYNASANLANTILQATVLTGGMLDSQDPPNGAGTLAQKLNYQANLIFPNGRLVNESLRKALIKAPADRNLADNAAIDSTICALEIADGTLAPNNTVVPHGAIYETTFLDARQVKTVESEPLYDPATNAPSTTIQSDYDLSIAERQPLEIRATVLDLELLRTTEITGTSAVPAPEYLLPDSGIIYATRDDAQLDLSAPGANPAPTAAPIDQPEADTRKANQKLNSPVDFIVDPHRRPNGILLTNGAILARKDNLNQYKQEERGLILATNLPAYIKAAENSLAAGTFGFNLHQDTGGNLLEEFTDQLTGRDWDAAAFYARTDNERDTNFACRNGTPGLNCNPGDLWRSATVISDAVTLLSDNFRFGFRNEGDYDLRKNVDNLTNNLAFQGYDANGNNLIVATDTVDETQLGFDLNGNGNATDTAVAETAITMTAARRLNGFFDNNYLRSANWFDNLGFPKDFVDDAVTPGIQGSSYVNNFVTPIQRRAEFPQYAMEMCLRPLVELCEPDDWVAGHDANGDGVLVATELNARASDLIAAAPQNQTDRWGAGTTVQMPLPFDLDGSGDAQPEEIEVLWHYPRRIAFQRNANNHLLFNGGMPVPLGVDGNTVGTYPYAGNRPPAVANALWYRTTGDTNVNPPTDIDYGNQRLFFTNQVANNLTQQPLLVPVMQLHSPEGAPGGNTLDPIGSGRAETWMQEPNGETTFNLIMATGDNPARPNSPGGLAEQNGGMPNLPIFLENWGEDRASRLTTNIAGSFIQFRRKAFATAPFLHVLDTAATDPLFGDYLQQYTGSDSQNRSPFYAAPNRAWGFDVGLLSQLPDLFSSLITTPSAGDPNEFYREVSRDDPWVETLLCAQTFDTATSTATGDAVSAESRPNNCP